MRPSLLDPLFAPVTSLPGVGENATKLLRRLFGRQDVRVIDLLLHLPVGAIDRRAQPKLRDVVPGAVVTVTVTVDSHRPPPPHRPRAPFNVYASDETGTLAITYFSARPDIVKKLLPVGSRRHVSGKAEIYDGMLQMVHPPRVVDDAGLASMALVEPVYPLTEGLSSNMLRRCIGAALEKVPATPEWLDSDHVTRSHWPAFSVALTTLHRPRSPADLAPDSKAWARLSYDELLANQLALALVRAHLRQPSPRRGANLALSKARRSSQGHPEPPVMADKPDRSGLRERLLSALPFQLTRSQRNALAEISSDLDTPNRMLRLIQGDVGSGKTVVALFACAAAIETGGQAALMAPTEILARQHLNTIAPLAAAIGLRVAILTGRERGRDRAAILDELARGDIDLTIGTHALFSDDVAFRDLALIVVDEQHRFGVQQRLALAHKGAAVDLLAMTATPIPRTLVLAYFGDLDISELRDKPPGRKPIDTRTLPLDRLDEVIAGIGRAIDSGRRVYWVCPLVEESENSDLAAAEARYAELQARFGDTVALVHGRLKAADKDAAMARFASGRSALLVATTVIEVGVDVPEASIMIIEHADRFGLSQLHQLRGRVGRGREDSTCLLLYKPPLGETAKARLAIMRDSDDGFRIAEEDLRLRGEGDLLGKRQSGMPGFRIAQIATHRDLMAAARADAALLLGRDPGMATTRGRDLRLLLYLFERDAAVPLLRAG